MRFKSELLPIKKVQRHSWSSPIMRARLRAPPGWATVASRRLDGGAGQRKKKLLCGRRAGRTRSPRTGPGPRPRS